MVLLTTGGWVDDLPNIPEASVECRYLADEQHIVFPGEGRMVRFPWLAATDAEHDMTDFFTDLRISAGNELMDEEIMSLYAHQRQQFPVEPISITLRNGEERVIGPDNESGSENGSESGSGSDNEVEREAEAEAEVEVDASSNEVEAEAEAEADASSNEVEREAEAEAEVDASSNEVEREAEAETEIETEANTNTKPEFEDVTNIESPSKEINGTSLNYIT
jgi:hypothetical protein